MYDGFYGFRDRPFSLLPDPEFLYLSPQHEKALGLLELSLHNQAGFCVISGEIGAGKTTLIRKLLTIMGDEFRVGLVTNTLDSFGDLLNWVLLAYELPTEGGDVERHERFIDFVIAQYGRGRRTVLVVDEAQNLTVDALEELRMLSNVNADKHQVLQVILVGQPGLRDTLKRPELTQFAQRILMDFHLAPLGREDTVRYIRHRLLVAGADPELFTPGAAAALYRYSGGIPRIINLLCDTALVYGYAEGSMCLTEELVHTVVRERQNAGAAPALRLAAMAPLETNPVEQVRAMAAVPDPVAVAIPAEEPDAVPPVMEAGPDYPRSDTAEPAATPEPEDAPSVDAPPAVESAGIEEEAVTPAPEATETGVAEPGQVPAEEPEPAAEMAQEVAQRSEEPVEPVAAAMPDEVSGLSEESAPETPVAPQPGPDLQSDAEWLRHLADSAIPPGVRERLAEESPEEAAVEATTHPAAAPLPAAPERRRHPGLGVAAGLVALVLAGGSAAYWFAGRDEGPVPRETVPAEPPVAAVAPSPRPQPEPEVQALQPPPEPEPVPAPVAEVPPPDLEAVPAPTQVRPAAVQQAPSRSAPVIPEPEPQLTRVQPETVAPPRKPAPSSPKPVTRAPAPVRKPVESPAPKPDPVRATASVAPPASKPERVVKPAVPIPSPREAAHEAPASVPTPAPTSAAVSAESTPPAPTSAVPVEAAPAPESVASSLPQSPPSTAAEKPAAPAAGAEDYRFSADPCKGPAARYLSTCR